MDFGDENLAGRRLFWEIKQLNLPNATEKMSRGNIFKINI